MATPEFSRQGEADFYYVWEFEGTEEEYHLFLDDFKYGEAMAVLEYIDKRLSKYKRLHKAMWSDREEEVIGDRNYPLHVVGSYEFFIDSDEYYNTYEEEYQSVTLMMRIRVFIEYGYYTSIPRMDFLIDFYNSDDRYGECYDNYVDIYEDFKIPKRKEEAIYRRVRWIIKTFKNAFNRGCLRHGANRYRLAGIMSNGEAIYSKVK